MNETEKYYVRKNKEYEDILYLNSWAGFNKVVIPCMANTILFILCAAIVVSVILYGTLSNDLKKNDQKHEKIFQEHMKSHENDHKLLSNLPGQMGGLPHE